MLLSKPGAESGGRGKAHRVRAGGLEGLFVPGEQELRGAGPRNWPFPGACDDGEIPSLTFQSLLGPQASTRQAQCSCPGLAGPPSSSGCAVSGPAPTSTVLLGDHFSRGLSSSPHMSKHPGPSVWAVGRGHLLIEIRGDKAWGAAACPVHQGSLDGSLPSSSSAVISFKKKVERGWTRTSAGEDGGK